MSLTRKVDWTDFIATVHLQYVSHSDGSTCQIAFSSNKLDEPHRFKRTDILHCTALDTSLQANPVAQRIIRNGWILFRALYHPLAGWYRSRVYDSPSLQ